MAVPNLCWAASEELMAREGEKEEREGEREREGGIYKFSLNAQHRHTCVVGNL